MDLSLKPVSMWSRLFCFDSKALFRAFFRFQALSIGNWKNVSKRQLGTLKRIEPFMPKWQAEQISIRHELCCLCQTGRGAGICPNLSKPAFLRILRIRPESGKAMGTLKAYSTCRTTRHDTRGQCDTITVTTMNPKGSKYQFCLMLYAFNGKEFKPYRLEAKSM